MGHTAIHQLSFILNLQNNENSIHLHDFGKFNTIEWRKFTQLICLRKALMTWHALEGDSWFPWEGSQPTSWKAEGNCSSWLPWFPLPRYYEAHPLLAISRAGQTWQPCLRWDTLRFIWQDILRFKVDNKNDNSWWRVGISTLKHGFFLGGGCFSWKQKTLGFPDLNVNFTDLLRLFPWSF